MVASGVGLSVLFCCYVAFKLSRIVVAQNSFELGNQVRGSASLHSLRIVSVSLKEAVKFPVKDLIDEDTYILCVTTRNWNCNLYSMRMEVCDA